MDKLNIKEWADNKFKENLNTIKAYIVEGLLPKKAYHIVMDNGTLGVGYKSQMRQEIGLSMFD